MYELVGFVFCVGPGTGDRGIAAVCGARAFEEDTGHDARAGRRGITLDGSWQYVAGPAYFIFREGLKRRALYVGGIKLEWLRT